MRQYPIWVDAVNCNRKSGNVTYGYRNDGETNYMVGSSASNSHQFVKTLITRRLDHIDETPVVRFRFSVDDIIVKEMVFSRDENGEVAKELMYSKYENLNP